MYAVSKGPIKIVTKARRGIPQNLERFDALRDLSRKPSSSEPADLVTVPKPVFHCNGKKSTHQRTNQDVITPQHEEIIRYINDTWNQIAECDSEHNSSDDDHPYTASVAPSNLYFKDSAPSPNLRNFKPFDLESWWGKRLFHNITKSL